LLTYQRRYRTGLSQAKRLKWSFTGCRVRCQNGCCSQTVRRTFHAESYFLTASRRCCDYV